jgi:hypothetical protein
LLKKHFQSFQTSTTFRGSFRRQLTWGGNVGGGTITPPANFGVGSTTRVNVVPNTAQFSVIFLDESNDQQLHFNPRPNEATVVENTKFNGVWGVEQRPADYPFVSGQPSTILFEQMADRFKVWVDGVHYPSMDFVYRDSFSSITSLTVSDTWTVLGVDLDDGRASVINANTEIYGCCQPGCDSSNSDTHVCMRTSVARAGPRGN